MESSDEATRKRWRTGFALAKLVEVRADGGGRDGEVFVQEPKGGAIGIASLPWSSGVLLHHDELDAIAGGEDQRLAHAGARGEGAGGVGEAAGRNGEAFTHLNGRREMIDAEQDQITGVLAHGVGNLCTAGERV